MIAFIGSVFSPYYHWSGRRDPENHVTFNVALYGPDGHAWAMTERGRAALSRDRSCLHIGKSSIRFDGRLIAIAFDETFLPWPGQRLLPRRMRGRIELEPAFLADIAYALDPEGRHSWQPVAPTGLVSVSCDAMSNGGWVGQGYHDMNFGSRPLEADFAGWDWARGKTADGRAILLYDSIRGNGENNRFGLTYSESGVVVQFKPPNRQRLKRGFWGVGGGIACDETERPTLAAACEDTPFYRRSLVETVLFGDRVRMMHETLDCRRLAMPIVRLMLPFRMPRRA
ncbi:carotenoid 1,2-hydratase [Peteryoungia ipomoeae]|uniref:Carotenoid 1,2-hydratase n=1 Tax=Peteryoungia ipomoeae TaxID=1210932 RepID=A0A4S8P381_9HYPH|nr:carotenoid 1,2-hydratase [Peteryoungia ipomoeae]THV23775.1 carotenoid 1,2-hydratase [Peteryoungia ipomoeae]